MRQNRLLKVGPCIRSQSRRTRRLITCQLNANLSRFLCIVLIATVGLLSGCGDRPGATALANAGITASSTLTNYYNSLAQDTVDIWEMEAFYDSLQGIPFDNNSQKLYQDRINALNHRAQMASDLGSIYGVLLKSASYDASGQVGDAALRLSKQLTSIPVFAGSGVDPSNLVKSVAGGLADWKQSKDLQKGSQLIIETLEAIEKLFQAESRVYKSIAMDRGLSVANVMEYMIQKNMVSTTPLLMKIPQALGLTLSTIPSDEKTTKAVIQLARVRSYRVALLSASVADTTDHALVVLIQNHKDFQSKSKLSLSTVLAGLQQAQTYLDEIAQLRSEKKE